MPIAYRAVVQNGSGGRGYESQVGRALSPTRWTDFPDFRSWPRRFLPTPEAAELQKPIPGNRPFLEFSEFTEFFVPGPVAVQRMVQRRVPRATVARGNSCPEQLLLRHTNAPGNSCRGHLLGQVHYQHGQGVRRAGALAGARAAAGARGGQVAATGVTRTTGNRHAVAVTHCAPRTRSTGRRPRRKPWPMR